MTVLSSHSWEQHSMYVGSTSCEVEASWKCSRTWWTSPRPGRWKSKRWETETIAYLFCVFFPQNSIQNHPSSAHDDSQDDLQLITYISTYDHGRSLYRSDILRISCLCFKYINLPVSVSVGELPRRSWQSCEARRRRPSTAMRCWRSPCRTEAAKESKDYYENQCSMQHWCEPILVSLLCRMICPHI